MKRHDVHRRMTGVRFSPTGGADIAVWAPLRQSVAVVAGGRDIPLERGETGFWHAATDAIRPGDLYGIRLDNDRELPDPASLAQPEGVHGRSQAVDLNAFVWSDGNWKNLPPDDYILYELHTGTFTPEGTFAGVVSKLDYLLSLGVTAVEIMPVAQFPGGRNWGYDGVFPFAVQDSYGGAEGLQRLVNACHERGLAVVLDVVYNHLGPEGNYLGEFGPYCTGKYTTPWGKAINYDDAYCDGVRRFVVDNALMWFRDFHIDALRLDAVHAIRDFSPTHILHEIRLHTDDLMEQTGRTHYLIVESDLNDTRFINSPERGGYGMDAQWIDEFHHALRVTSGQERTGYYEDFAGIGHLAKAYRDAYVYDGQYSEYRKKHFGIPTDNPARQFVVFSQNHDQVGNRMLGERTGSLVGCEMQKLLAGAVIAGPYIPLLFMGEEYGETNPFLYFVSHTDPELAEAVRRGRREEFAEFHAQGEAPDPLDEETFRRSKLQWHLSEQEPHRTLFRYYRTLIRLRKKHPVLRTPDRGRLRVGVDERRAVLQLERWNDELRIQCLMNFSPEVCEVVLPADAAAWSLLLDSASPEWLGPAAAPEHVAGGGRVAVQPESFVIYETSFHENSSGGRHV